jgi:3-oxoacyl-[acyl-carrier protein] reductase
VRPTWSTAGKRRSNSRPYDRHSERKGRIDWSVRLNVKKKDNGEEIRRVKEIGRKDCARYRRLARYWCCNRYASGRRRSERGYYVHESADAAASVIKETERAGGKAIAIHADAADADAGKAAVEKTVRTFGRLDVLVNNAGTAIPKTFEETTLEEMDRVIDINVRGVFVATQAALKHMKSGGRVIMIGSAVGERVLVPGLVPYSATKGAVKMFTQGLSREVASRGITVNKVQPGPIDTDLNPAAGDWAAPQKAATALDRYGHVDEVAALVAFVAGPESSYITGANLTVDGGMNA